MLLILCVDVLVTFVYVTDFMCGCFSYVRVGYWLGRSDFTKALHNNEKSFETRVIWVTEFDRPG